MCDTLFLLDASPADRLTAIAEVVPLFAAAETLLLLDQPETEMLLSLDALPLWFEIAPPPNPGGGGPCPHMTALMDTYNQPIRESATGFVILVETHP